MRMTCPGCHSFDLDGSMYCDGCGYQLSVKDEVRLRGLILVPRQQVADDRLDLAMRGVT